MTVQTEYTPAEQRKMLEGMELAAGEFYKQAVFLGYHQFVEFAGFMNETIKACEKMSAEGKDFATRSLELEPYMAGYLGEKLGCIFGHALADRVVRQAFLDGLDK